MAQQLFVGTPLSVLFDNTHRNIEDDIRKPSDDQILAAELDTLVQQLTEKNLIQVPVLNVEAAERTFMDATVPERQVPNPNFIDVQIGVPGRVHTLHIPFSGQEHIYASGTAALRSPW